MGSVLFVTIFIALQFATGLANPEAKRLYDDLLSNYNRLIRPVGNNSDRLTVKMGLRLSQLIDVVSIIWIIIKICWIFNKKKLFEIKIITSIMEISKLKLFDKLNEIWSQTFSFTSISANICRIVWIFYRLIRINRNFDKTSSCVSKFSIAFWDTLY